MPEFILHPQLEKDTFFIGSLDLSDILLMNDSRYPWIILVPRVNGAVDMTDLYEVERLKFTEEINQVASSMKKAYQPDRINIAMLGNVVPQLHCHIIARFKEDFAWAKPVWGVGDTVNYSNDEAKKIVDFMQMILKN